MNSTVRTALVFSGLLVAVVAASYLYSRSIRDVPSASASAAGGQQNAPPDQRELHPGVKAGIDALRAERFEEARQQLESIASDDPSYLVALQNLGSAYTALGELEAAHSALAKLAELQPDDPVLYLSLAWAQHRLGLDLEAERTALWALEIDPRNLAARYDVAYFRVAQGTLAPAIRAYQRAVQQDVSQTHVMRAAQNLEQLQAARPALAQTHYAMAYFARVLGQSRVEREELEAYLALEPSGTAASVARERLNEVPQASP
jgi:Flp pilus assembly protein TadD